MTPFIQKLSAIFTLLCLPFFSYSQDTVEQIWVTFESAEDVPVAIEGKLKSKNASVQTLIDQYSIIDVMQAVPTSTKEALQKVYEVSCHCDAEALSKEIETRSSALTKPLPAPVYTLLNDPDDYSLSFQTDYALDLINAKEAWQYSIGDESTIIGVSDANYYITHEELERKIEYLDPQNFSTNYYHSTAVAITAAGDTDNGKGKSSIGYNCKLSLTSISYSKALQMSQDGIRVINLSWATGCSPNSYVQSIVDEIYENGTILVAAAGNGSTCGGPTNQVFPAACDKVISVSSVGSNDKHERIDGDPSSSHQHNSTVDICAPGYNVALSPFPEYYNYASGTSFAAPLVSGTIGLMISLRPCLTNEEIIEILRMSSDDIYALNPSYIGQLRWGRLNAGRALELTEMNDCMGNWNTTTSPNLDTMIVFDTGSGISGNDTGNATEPEPEQTISHEEHVDNKLVFSDNQDLSDLSEIAEITVSVYPNPTSGSAVLQWDFNETMTLSVLDARGVLVDQQELLSEMNKTDISLEESGVYFLRITRNNQQEWFGKLIKF
jgi:hypothetical protein